jgi:hypothetical protein
VFEYSALKEIFGTKKIKVIYTVTCGPTARDRATNVFPYRWILGNQLVTEHISVDTKMKDVSNGDRFLETNTSLWDQQAFP